MTERKVFCYYNICYWTKNFSNMYSLSSPARKITKEDSDRTSYANVISDVSNKIAYLFFILLIISIFLKEYYKDLKNN